MKLLIVIAIFAFVAFQMSAAVPVPEDVKDKNPVPAPVEAPAAPAAVAAPAEPKAAPADEAKEASKDSVSAAPAAVSAAPAAEEKKS